MYSQTGTFFSPKHLDWVFASVAQWPRLLCSRLSNESRLKPKFAGTDDGRHAAYQVSSSARASCPSEPLLSSLRPLSLLVASQGRTWWVAAQWDTAKTRVGRSSRVDRAREESTTATVIRRMRIKQHFGAVGLCALIYAAS